MARVPAKVIEGGRVTIPADKRDEEDIEVGDYVLLDVKKLEDQTVPNRHRLR